MTTKSIYIVLTDSGTWFSQTIKAFTNAPYNHASIALDPELDTLYSFGRKSLRFPLNAGFVKERPGGGLFEKKKQTRCLVLALPVDETTYERAADVLARFERDADRYTYNFWGLFNFVLPVRIQRRSAFFCSEFVATVLKNSGAPAPEKAPSVTAPHDFMSLQPAMKIFEGRMAALAGRATA
ncbi:hypothetical protein MO973_02945 [Paenibacillus sp. TRM 82003]|nr:hypothetical protein [Paenibacillus sp. TRM 82003]